MKQAFVCVTVERRDPIRPWRGSWFDEYFVSYDFMVSRRTNLRRARRLVSTFSDVVKVCRCYCDSHCGR